ncbi:MAG: hypothetical protein FWG80_01665 [Alphaproteobacteria bacterium]|nr:hypothetical protein [Alphaproteobacteria bacterium]
MSDNTIQFYGGTYYLSASPEFIHHGINILSDKRMTPWHVDPRTFKAKTWFIFDNNIVHYRENGQKFYARISENCNISYPYQHCFAQKYGYKIKTCDDRWYFETNPENTISPDTILSCDDAFVDIIIGHPDEKEKHPKKYVILKKKVYKKLCDIIDPEIQIPHKTIVCAFKSNFDQIENQKPVLNTITKFAYMMNFGRKPGNGFYNCDKCLSNPVCVYKDHMKKFCIDYEENKKAENLKKYISVHGHAPLFPELLQTECFVEQKKKRSR